MEAINIFTIPYLNINSRNKNQNLEFSHVFHTILVSTVSQTKTMQTSRFGYTFIELMIVITLVFIVTMMTYLPYSYYQNKMKIKQTGKEIAQLLYDARNDALNGYISWGSNQSIWVYLDTNTPYASLLAYPHSIDASTIVPTSGLEIERLSFLPGIHLTDVWWHTALLFLFDAISGSGSYHYWDTAGVKHLVTGDTIHIDFSYKNASSPWLQRQLQYHTHTNIIDY